MAISPPMEHICKPNQNYLPTAIHTLVAELREHEFKEFLNLMDCPSHSSILMTLMILYLSLLFFRETYVDSRFSQTQNLLCTGS
jgi:hypothetical protein